jgi:hypothetical protein
MNTKKAVFLPAVVAYMEVGKERAGFTPWHTAALRLHRLKALIVGVLIIVPLYH